MFEKFKFFVRYLLIYFSSVHHSDSESSVKSSSKNKALLIVVLNLVEQPKVFDQIRSLVSFSDTTFKYSVLMYLSVVAAHLLLIEYRTVRYCHRVAFSHRIVPQAPQKLCAKLK